MSNFDIITVSSHRPEQWYYCYDEFFRSIQKYGHEVTVLGNRDTYKSLISKPKLLRQHILSGGVKSDTVLFADSWDILFMRDPAEAVALAPKDSVIFNAEKNLFPHLDGEFPDHGTPYRYLNSGFFIGHKDMILALLESMNLDDIRDDYQKPDGSWHHENDQKNYLEAFIRQPVPMTLDYEVKLCQTMHGITDEEALIAENGHLYNRLTNSFPVALHGNGNGKQEPLMLESLRRWKERNA